MTTTSDLDRVTMVVLRHLRKPVFALIIVYAIGITGMALIPGTGADGEPESMSLFHAFYFFTYTATTTGFGEIPHVFNDVQRLWAIFCLYIGAIAWLYAIGSIIGLVQNPHFTRAVDEQRFARKVRQMTDPFVIICGFGDTGSLLARGLSDHHLQATVLDRDPERIKAFVVRDYRVKMRGLCAHPDVPRHLIDAGVTQDKCKAVVALTNEEDTNRQITIVSKLLNPAVRVISRSTSERHCKHLNSLNDVQVVNPFAVFAELLDMAIVAPRLHNLNSWLVGVPGTRLGHPLKVPCGIWILCGYGRMGKELHRRLVHHGIQVVIIDPDAKVCEPAGRIVRGFADFDTLREAGVEQAAGIVAGTDNDSDNLGILVCVRHLNSQAFMVVRQNQHENQLAFDAGRADLILQSSLTTARRILKSLISPLIQEMIEHLYDQEQKTEEVVNRLQATMGEQAPHLFRIGITPEEASAVMEYMEEGKPLLLSDLIRDPNNLEGTLPCVPLVIRRGEEIRMLPDDNEAIIHGDGVLLCGTERSERILRATLNNPYTLHYLTTGVELPRGFVFQWIEGRRKRGG
ncbi:potassium channel family protein [Granulosicoccus antarcticus]|uniref:Glutathione-regulated potassium-efflux system protein KefB n=1 Tax=Granulosicoccus antarcticus IMCC3135 TaxID=1192854 RepID=A0A2Z2NIU7_9GAMM|nr:NAD(P)-binding protein [Granulosicoccus antarcticus]ASJ71079.1 Glutathione-regulated potassium-efflux system protein KefB [Granulosicoccus antarcticus IMCC3135]